MFTEEQFYDTDFEFEDFVAHRPVSTIPAPPPQFDRFDLESADLEDEELAS